MSFIQDFPRPTRIRIDFLNHPAFELTAHRFEISDGVIMFYLAGRLVQLIPLAKIEHLWQVAEEEGAGTP